jgi:hypothetical protein
MAMPALGASVEPTPINEGNPTCSDFDASWTELKVEPPADGDYTDGTLEITISNFSNDDPKGFDWESNIGVDAVFVKAGSDKHNLYVYDPESLGDTDLGPQDGQGNGISHISFCYDADEETPTPTPTPEITPTPTPESSEEAGTPTPTATPREDTQGGNPTPTAAPLPNTAMGSAGTVPALALSLMLIGSLAAMAYLRVARQR